MNYDNWRSTQADPFADDERPEDSQQCLVCGADGDEDCTADCDCALCLILRDDMVLRDDEAERRQQARANDPTPSEVASVERDTQEAIYRGLK